MLVDDIRIDGMKVSFSLLFPKETDPFLKSTIKAAEAAIHYYVSKEVEVNIKTEFKTKTPPKDEPLLPLVKNMGRRVPIVLKKEALQKIWML